MCYNNLATHTHQANPIVLTADYTALVGTRQGTIVPVRPVSAGCGITCCELYRLNFTANFSTRLRQSSWAKSWVTK